LQVRVLDSIEINDAFAPQVLAYARRLVLPLDRVNTDGGAIALGHMLGPSGVRLLLNLLGRLERDDAAQTWPASV